jgi:hypothetical protein
MRIDSIRLNGPKIKADSGRYSKALNMPLVFTFSVTKKVGLSCYGGLCKRF